MQPNVVDEAPERAGDEVQIFDVAEGLRKRSQLNGRVDLARSSGCYIAVFQHPPGRGETHIHQHPDSDQILFILEGECTVEGLSGKTTLQANQGVLIPAGVHYGFCNTGAEDVVFLSMRTEGTGGRRVAYVRNVPSDVEISVPDEMIGAKGFGHRIYAYALNSTTIGISPLLMEEWNMASLLRMHCDFERQDGRTTVRLPERLARWYQLDQLHEDDYTLMPDGEPYRVRVSLKRDK
jgi:mannose-6-phosphate isomerase-like protein (cupin superfamily)